MWLHAFAESGSTGGGYTTGNRGFKKIGLGKQDVYMKEYPEAFLNEVAEAFSCCIEAACKALLRNHYTRKKRLAFTKSVTQRHAMPMSKR
jgi:hypothetical protein